MRGLSIDVECDFIVLHKTCCTVSLLGYILALSLIRLTSSRRSNFRARARASLGLIMPTSYS